MRKQLLALALAVCSSAANAKIVNLECELSSLVADEPVQWSIALNEGAGTVTFSHRLGHGTKKARFTPAFVSWSGGNMKIDRRSLVFTRDIAILAPFEHSEGQCHVAAKKKS